MMRTFPRARWVALASIVAISFVSGGWLLRARPAAGGGVYQQARLFENVVGAINRHYIDSLGEGDLYKRAAGALVGSLQDPYAELLIGESYREYQRQMTGTEDLGRESRPTESGWDDGTNPTVVLVRPRGAGQPGVRRLTPATVHVPAASPGVLMDGKVGYVVLRRLSEGAAEELRTAVDQMVAKGMKALVMDVRSNPGGLIREGVKIAGLFLQPGDTIATSEGRSGRHPKTYQASSPAGWDKLRVVLLVNRGTASSAELIAGALQDHDRAVIVGTPSYGKGVLQTTYPLGDEVALKLTTAVWFTPSGRTVQRLRPDAVGAPGNRTPAIQPRIFRTDAGRPIPDASGILPDLTVRTSLRSDGERVLHSALGDDLDHFRMALTTYVGDLRANGTVTDESFQITPEMRDGLYHRIEQEGVALSPETFQDASSYVDEQLGYEITRELFGTESVVRRQAKADRQLQAALRVLRGSRTQQEALTAAVAAQASGGAR